MLRTFDNVSLYLIGLEGLIDFCLYSLLGSSDLIHNTANKEFLIKK